MGNSANEIIDPDQTPLIRPNSSALGRIRSNVDVVSLEIQKFKAGDRLT